MCKSFEITFSFLITKFSCYSVVAVFFLSVSVLLPIRLLPSLSWTFATLSKTPCSPLLPLSHPAPLITASVIYQKEIWIMWLRWKSFSDLTLLTKVRIRPEFPTVWLRIWYFQGDIWWFKQKCFGYFMPTYYFKKVKDEKALFILYIKNYIFSMYKHTGAHSL